MNSHEIDFQIFGEEMQYVEIELDPYETVIAEAGSFMMMDSEIKMATIFGDGSHQESKGGIWDKVLTAGKRLLTGESLFLTAFTHGGTGKKRVSFASPYPGKIIPLDLSKFEGKIVCQKDAFLCAAKGVHVGIEFSQKLGRGLFGGEGFIMQKLEGDGMAFVHAGGHVTKRELALGEALLVDTGCLVAFTRDVHYDIEMVKGITKAAYSPRNAVEAIQALHEAWEAANQARFGPVLIDLPIDVQQLPIEGPTKLLPTVKLENQIELEDEVFSLVNCAIQNSRKPLILVGGGVALDQATSELKSFVDKTQIPVVATLMGLDSAAKLSSLNLGFIGSYGNRWANEALKRSDLLIVLGCRLDPRQTGASIEEFKKDKIIVRIDIDNFELEGRVEADIKIRSRIGQFLSDPRLNKEVKISSSLIDHSYSIKISKPQTEEQEITLSLNPNEFLEKISFIHREAEGYIVDVGQHQMWAAQSIKVLPNQRFLTSGGLGAMGFSLPAAIGASIAKKGDWVVILGDGCAQLSAPELQTISELDLPISIYVMNNRQHGMVAQFQDENLESRYVGTRFGYSTPDFCVLAETYGFRNTFTINSINQLGDLESRKKSISKGPVLVNVVISSGAKALPKMKG